MIVPFSRIFNGWFQLMFGSLSIPYALSRYNQTMATAALSFCLRPAPLVGSFEWLAIGAEASKYGFIHHG